MRADGFSAEQIKSFFFIYFMFVITFFHTENDGEWGFEGSNSLGFSFRGIKVSLSDIPSKKKKEKSKGL